MKCHLIVGTIIALGLSLSAQAAKPHLPYIYKQEPKLLEQSKQYSQYAIERHPEAGVLLEKLGLKYLHQLDPSKTYRLDLRTGEVAILERDNQDTKDYLGVFTGGTFIDGDGPAIVGIARMKSWCPIGGQTAEVSGFMASTVSRDPIAGIRTGIIVSDSFIQTTAQATFSILKIPGGARNPQNRTVMESTHEAACGDGVFFEQKVATWPPLRVEMAIDDTGSMSNELSGAKTALASFIGSQGQNIEQPNRGVSYELISFKDAPALVLASTTDTSAAMSAVNSLYASGGGDCPEDATGALSLAVNRAAADEDHEGAVVLVTDASPRGGDVGGLISAARAAGIKVHVMLSGDCVSTAAKSNTGQAEALSSIKTDSARVVFERIARETSGMYFYHPGGTADDYSAILEKIFSSAYVGDSEPPTVTVTVTPGVLWPANHKMVRVDAKVTATDNQDPHPIVELDGITSSEPKNGLGDGDTPDDIMVGGNGAISLRAERSGSGLGRIYTIKYRATDASGNVGYGLAEVVVPHDAD